MKIGNFTKNEDGRFVGRIETLSIERDAQFVPVTDKLSDKAPDFRVLSMDESVEYAPAWNETSEAGNPYLSVVFDDPLASKPIYAVLTRDDDGAYNLYWSRSKPKSGKKKTAAKETL